MQKLLILSRLALFYLLSDLGLSRGASGSLESLTSLGADSVMTGLEGIGASETQNLRQPLISSPEPRSPLQSSSSLELSPGMEQVSLIFIKIYVYIICFKLVMCEICQGFQ